MENEELHRIADIKRHREAQARALEGGPGMRQCFFCGTPIVWDETGLVWVAARPNPDRTICTTSPIGLHADPA